MSYSKKLRKEAGDLIYKWRPRLYLNEWNIDLHFPKEDLESNGSMDTLCDITACPVYLTARINIYPGWFDRDESKREKALVHELCHCLTQEMNSLAESLQNSVLVTMPQRIDALERLTQRITNIALYQQMRKG